jgi:hypothetical protein
MRNLLINHQLAPVNHSRQRAMQKLIEEITQDAIQDATQTSPALNSIRSRIAEFEMTHGIQDQPTHQSTNFKAFPELDACLISTDQHIKNLQTYDQPVVIGCSLSQRYDWTVLIAMEANSGKCLDISRFKNLDWPHQKVHVVSFVRKWRGKLCINKSVNYGNYYCEDLNRVIPHIEPFIINPTTKTLLIQKLNSDVQHIKVFWPQSMPELTEEMRNYEFLAQTNGQPLFKPPKGHSESCVIALALANYARHKVNPPNLNILL